MEKKLDIDSLRKVCHEFLEENLQALLNRLDVEILGNISCFSMNGQVIMQSGEDIYYLNQDALYEELEYPGRKKSFSKFLKDYFCFSNFLFF